VGIEALEQRIEGLKVKGSERVKLRKPLVLLKRLLDGMTHNRRVTVIDYRPRGTHLPLSGPLS
jgi:hypothetical protein